MTPSVQPGHASFFSELWSPSFPAHMHEHTSQCVSRNLSFAFGKLSSISSDRTELFGSSTRQVVLINGNVIVPTTQMNRRDDALVARLGSISESTAVPDGTVGGSDYTRLVVVDGRLHWPGPGHACSSSGNGQIPPQIIRTATKRSDLYAVLDAWWVTWLNIWPAGRPRRALPSRHRHPPLIYFPTL
jgi:hypothetical protein